MNKDFYKKYSRYTKSLGVFALLGFISFPLLAQHGKLISLKDESIKNLYILADDLINVQNLNKSSEHYGALYCKSCEIYHSRASESVLPFSVAYKESGDKKYLQSAISTGNWLITQQEEDGSWQENPDTWTGTTTDQLLSMATAYPVLKNELTKEEQNKWVHSIKIAADWLTANMSQGFASINYCATTTASLMLAYQVVPDSAYVMKAKELASNIIPKFDDDYFLTGEGNRIRGTKYGIDFGYNLEMSLWGLGLYAKLNGDERVNNYVKKSLKRMVYFIYPDGSIDDSWGVRSSKWTTYGSFTSDGSQITFGLYSEDNPVYRNAAVSNLNYLMQMREKGLLTYGPDYYEIFDEAPCIYPTFAKAKNLALTILYGDQTKGKMEPLPSQKTGWVKYFNTLDIALVRTKNFMATVTGYRYKDIRRGADFKYMHRPSGGSITNLWVQDYGYLQASSQTEYHKWEMNYPDVSDSAITITPRIEFRDENAYYTNLYDFDTHIETSDSNGVFFVKTLGQLKDRNRWEGGIAYNLTQKISDTYVEKDITLRFHGNSHPVTIIEPFIKGKNTLIKKIDDQHVEITKGNKKFLFSLLNKNSAIQMGENEAQYGQPFPALKGYPLSIQVAPSENSLIKTIRYRIELENE